MIVEPTVQRAGRSEVALILLPYALQWDWSEQSKDLRNGDALVGIVDNVHVQLSDGRQMHITDVLADEFMRIQHHNPNLKMQLKWTQAFDYTKTKFRSREADRFVFWVEGDIRNFQMKRTMLLLMEHVLRAMHGTRVATGSAS